MRILWTCVAIALAGLSAGAQGPDLDRILADIRAKDTGQLAVSEEDGRFLRLLVASTGRKMKPLHKLGRQLGRSRSRRARQD